MAQKPNKTSSSSSLASGSSHSSRSSFNQCMGVEQPDWKERCQLLEGTVTNFKQQAAKIRGIVTEKMKELETKTADAERKATEMEEKNIQLEQRLRMLSPNAGDLEQTLQRVNRECQQQQQLVAELQSQLEDQRAERKQHMKAMEEKSVQIKSFVSKKVNELEIENSKLKEDNGFLKHQVDVLRTRLQALPITTAREIHRVSVQDSDDSLSGFANPPPVPEKPPSALLASIRQQHQAGQSYAQSSTSKSNVSRTSSSNTPQDISPDSEEGLAIFRNAWKEYHEIDDNHQSKYEPKKKGVSGKQVFGKQAKGSSGSGPPKVKIERRVFPNPDLYRCSTASEDMLEKPQSDPSSPPIFRTLPKNLHLNAIASPQNSPIKKQYTDSHRLPMSSRNNAYNQPIYASPRKGATSKKVSHLLQTQQSSSLDSEEHDYSEPPPPDFRESEFSSTYTKPEYADVAEYLANEELDTFAGEPVSATRDNEFMRRNIPSFATMPRRKKDPPGKFYPAHSKTQLASEEPVTGENRPGFPLGRSLSERRANPPTPPTRRMPSWEERIYAIAAAGLQVTDLGDTTQRQSSIPVTDGLYTGFEDMTVPVYTTLRGKAARIRSAPFSEASSSSSDTCSDIEDMSRSTPITCAVLAAHEQQEATVSVAGPFLNQPGVSSIKVRKHVAHTSSGAIKRATSTHSLVSESSSDYALPPDEVSIQHDSGDSEPEHKLLKYTTHHIKRDHLEKSGYLTKLSGKVKHWKRRWFVLRCGEILYYKSPNDVSRKPEGYILIDAHSKINKTDAAQTFELVTRKKAYYFTAENAEDALAWFKVIQNVLRKQIADSMLAGIRNNEVVKGWIIKTRKGRNKRCWCVLVGKILLFYKGSDDKTPRGQINVEGARVEEIDRSVDSETDSDDTDLPEYTILLWPPKQPPTYLMIATQHEKDSWLYALTTASGNTQASSRVGTEYEQLVSQLSAAEGEPGNARWDHPLLLYSKEPLEQPLTTLASENLQNKACQLFKSCQRFSTVAIESSQLDVHVSLAQSILSSCHESTQLQNELYCQLIKQTSPHPVHTKSGMQNLLCGSHSWFLCDASSPTSPTNSQHTAGSPSTSNSHSKVNPPQHVFVQGWQLLCLTISMFLPRFSILWYLKAHLQRHANPRTDIGKYAVFCQRAVDRATKNGPRESSQPSRMEVLSILLRHPYHHSQPMSVPVHLANSTYQVVSFDGCTTIEELLDSLNRALGMRHYTASGFALFTDDPMGNALEHYLKPQLKICDVISDWELAYLKHAHAQGLNVKVTELTRTVRITYKKHMHFNSQARGMSEKEKLLVVYETNTEIIEGRFPLSKELAEELCVLMAQIEYGDFKSPGDAFMSNTLPRGRITPPHSLQQLPQVLERFYPRRYLHISPTQRRCLEKRLAEKWLWLRGRTMSDCVRVYVTVVRKWPFLSAKLFSAQVRGGSMAGEQVWLAVREDSISLLHPTSLAVIQTHPYKSVLTFGGCRDDLMLVVKQRGGVALATESTQSPRHLPAADRSTQRLLFSMSKPKILEITMLMTAYINTPDNRERSQ